VAGPTGERHISVVARLPITSAHVPEPARRGWPLRHRDTDFLARRRSAFRVLAGVFFVLFVLQAVGTVGVLLKTAGAQGHASVQAPQRHLHPGTRW
jgi:hypothetical protein